MPAEMIRRERIFNTLRKVFERYGFSPLESPALESWELLSKKGGLGEEAVKDIFRFKDKAGREVGLRFDLTVPLARIVVANPQLPKPFKRYQISRVWRYEEVRRGRYREFWQADIDVVGSASMLADAEVLAVAVDALQALGFKRFYIRLNDRKVLENLVTLAGIPSQKFLPTCRALDKLQKIGTKKVGEELKVLGIKRKSIQKVFSFIGLKGTNRELLKKAKRLGVQVANLEEVLRYAKEYGIVENLKVDFSLARGLDYYTGPVYEAMISGKEEIGAVAAGGRYDDLIKLFGGPPTPATGISFGVERIDALLAERKIEIPSTKTKVFVANATPQVRVEALHLAQHLRTDGLAVETDVMERKLERQLEYADSLGIPYVLILGKKELEKSVVRVRDMKKRVEEEVSMKKVSEWLQKRGQ
jgi:histidyl-tRNA synthetase